MAELTEDVTTERTQDQGWMLNNGSTSCTEQLLQAQECDPELMPLN